MSGRNFGFILGFNAVIITEATGKIEFEGVIENVTYKVESDEATALNGSHLAISLPFSTKSPSLTYSVEP